MCVSIVLYPWKLLLIFAEGLKLYQHLSGIDGVYVTNFVSMHKVQTVLIMFLFTISINFFPSYLLRFECFFSVKSGFKIIDGDNLIDLCRIVCCR
jgi:hypothetical protein